MCDLYRDAAKYTENNSRTFKDPETEIQRLSKINPTFKDFQSLKFRKKIPELLRLHGNQQYGRNIHSKQLCLSEVDINTND